MVNVVNVETNRDLLAIADTLDAGHSAVTYCNVGGRVVVKRNHVFDGCDDVFNGEHGLFNVSVETELAVDLVTTDLGEVVALGIEVEVVEKCTGGFGSNLLTWTQLAVDVLEGFFLGEDVVFLQGGFDRWEPLELVKDLFAREAEGLQEYCDRLIALAVDTNADLVALIDLELEPRTTARDDASRVNVFVAELLWLTVEVHTRRTHELRHNHALGSVDDEGTASGHEREVAHEHGLSFDLTGEVVHELGVHVERRSESLTALLALVDRVLRFFKLGIRERQLHCLTEVFDRRDLFKDFVETTACRQISATGGHTVGYTLFPDFVTHEPVKALGLQCEQIRNRECVSNFCERKPRC